MKKILIILIALFAFVTLQAQTVIQHQYTAMSILGEDDADTLILAPIEGEYDISLQLIPVSISGDSLHCTYVVYQSNHRSDAAWTAITSAAVLSTVTDTDGDVNITDFKGLRLRIIAGAITAGTGGSDSVSVTVYSVYKKHAEE